MLQPFPAPISMHASVTHAAISSECKACVGDEHAPLMTVTAVGSATMMHAIQI